MSTIHTALTGKTDSLIDAVRESEEQKLTELIRLRDAELQRQREHPETMDTIHPDYMRMVVHQMD